MAHRVQLRARWTHQFTYSGRSVLVTDLAGRVPKEDPLGLYFDNTRILSRFELTTDGKPPDPVSASPVGGDAHLTYAVLPESGGVSKESVYIETTHFVGDGMRTILRLRSFATKRVAFVLAIEVAADFADSEEAEQRRRQQTAEIATEWDADAREVQIRYLHPELDRAVAIRVEQAPTAPEWTGETLRFRTTLEPRGTAELELAIEPIFDGRRIACTPRRSFVQAAAPLERLRNELTGEMPVLVSSNATVSRAWETATRDLATLSYGLADGPATPIAGLPLYQQFFGRDSLTIG
jgi:glycogen debranching enzyme